MSNEQACKKAMKHLDYDISVTIGSYIGELKSELKQLRDAQENESRGIVSPGETK